MEGEGRTKQEMELGLIQGDEEGEIPHGVGEAAAHSGGTDPLLYEIALEGSLTERQQLALGPEDDSLYSQSETSHTGGTVLPPVYSVNDSADVPAGPEPSLHMSITISANEDGEDPARAAEEQTELVVLDPEHPLMKRFQSALKNHLKTQLDRLNMELRENLATERAECARREELGVELYSVQQELARLQANLEGRHEASTQATMQHRQAQEQLEGVRSEYSILLIEASQQRAQVSQLQTELESFALNLLYMQEASEGMRSDMAAMKNASSRAHAEKLQAEEEKQKQDLYVERLTRRVEKLTEQITFYEAQTVLQAKDTQAAKQLLAEAQMEMDSLMVDRRQLLQQWSSSLVVMRHRDEAYATMCGALREARHRVRSLETEIEGFKKSTMQEEERNEMLTALLRRAQTDQATSRRLIAHSQAQQEALQAQYTTYTRTLQETEQALARLTAECATREAEVTEKRKEAERESAIRLDVEDKIVAKIQEQLAHNNAAKHTHGLFKKVAAQKREKEAQLSRLDNEMAHVALESSETKLRLESMVQLLAELEQEVAHHHELLSHSEAEIKKRMAIIGRKQATINLYNKKIEQIVASTGHEDLGPLEIKVSTLTKELEEMSTETKEQQQFSLCQQGELVRLTQEREAQVSALLRMQMQLTVLQQRKVRIDGEIQQEQREQAELDRHMKDLMADTVKLNTLLSKNSQLREALKQGNVLMEKDFLHRLKEAERESVEMQMKLQEIQEDKERLINSLLEAERQIMLWEKKTQLMKETQSAIDSDVGQGDIRSMKAEIHRMEVRYAHLMKQQERLLRDMEASVARRETVVVRSEAQARADKKQPTKTDFHMLLQGLRRRIQDTHKQAGECDGIIKELTEQQENVSASIRETQQQLAGLQSTSTALTADLRRLQDTKEQNLARLVALQGRAKQLRAVQDGCYGRMVTSEEALEPAIQRQEERIHAISTVLHRVCQELPQHQGTLHRLSLALANQLQGPQE